MPYIGGLKSYLLFPVLEVFGSGVIVQRVFNIGMMSAALGLTYASVLYFSTKRTALIVLALLASNASIIAFGRTDFGPVILELIFKVLSLLALVIFMRKRQLRYLFAMGLMLLLGEFNKINFLWFTHALYACLFFDFLAYWRAKKKLLLNNQAIATLIGIYMLAFVYYVIIVKYYHIGGGFKLADPGFVLRSLTSTLGGQWYYNALLEARASYYASYALFAVQVVPIVYGVRYGLLRTKGLPLFKWCLIIMAVLLAQIAVTPNATAAWHYLAVQPFWALAVALSTDFWYKRVKGTRRTAINVLLVALCVAQLSIYVLQIPLLRSTHAIAWSKGIYQLADTTKKLDGKVLAADWGLQTQLIALDPTYDKYQEVFGPFDIKKASEIERMTQMYFSSTTTTYIVTHPRERATFPETQDSVLYVARTLGSVKQVAVIQDEGRPVYVIYRLTR